MAVLEITSIGAIITYVIPVGECPRKTKFVEARGDGRAETVAEFYDRCKALTLGCDLISIELKEIQ